MEFIYGKVFESIFDSTLAAEGGWLPTYIFASMIVLADKDGIVEIAPKALYRRLAFGVGKIEISYQEFTSALSYLQEDDPGSSSPEANGRRIIPLADLREYGNRGFKIVNYMRYRDKGRRDERAALSTERVRKWREKQNKNNDETQCSASKRGNPHTDTDTDTEREKHTKLLPLPCDFKTTPEMENRARELGIIANLRLETEKFRAHHQSKGTVSQDWDAEWIKWVLRTLEHPTKAGTTAACQIDQEWSDTVALAKLYGLERQPRESKDAFTAKVTEVNNRRLAKLQGA